MTEFVFVRVAIGAIKSFGSFVSATDTQAISTYLESFEVVNVIGANRNFSIEVTVEPISIPAEAVTFAKALVL